MLTLVCKENEQDQAHIFQEIYMKSSQIYQLTIMCCFEPINIFLFQNLYKPFLQTFFACA